MPDLSKMSDSQIKAAIRDICRRSTTDDEVKKKLELELGYKGNPASVTHETNTYGRTVLTSWTVVLDGPRGKAIHVNA